MRLRYAWRRSMMRSGEAGLSSGGTRWSVSCDFDGTITCEDMVQAMLAEFADPSWLTIEAEWEAGLIGARDCLARQTALLRMSEIELARWVDQQPLDPDAGRFLAACIRCGHDLRVVSDGYDWVIARVMSRLGLEHVPVFANRLRPSRDGRWCLEFPYAQAGCAAGACKCRLVGASRPRLHIGDGRSDFCVSDQCEHVFAKGSLLAHRDARGLPSIAFETFADLDVELDRLCGHIDEDLANLPISAVG